MKLLVADDERWIRKGILKMLDLAELGFEETAEAASLGEYEDKFRVVRPEIVISDVRFPNGTSCELCQRLYELSPETKFIMLSGYNDFEFVKAALGYKAVDYLLKPVDKRVLNDTVRRAIQEYNQKEGLLSRHGEKAPIRSEKDAALKNAEQAIRQVMEEITRDCARRFTLSELAGRYHISEAYFSNMFAKTAGVSLMSYIMEIRVEKAKALLLQTEKRISDISLAVGYEDTRYFAKVFRRLTGESPSDYRYRQRQDMEDYEEK